jgi:predicted nucleic acid-binding Zn ribbon protein
MYIGNNTQHIKQIIEALRKERKLKKGLEKAQVNKIWQELMGDTIGKFTSNLSYDNGTLSVYLNSSALREELNRGKDKIINRLNEHYGEVVIKKIIFK